MNKNEPPLALDASSLGWALCFEVGLGLLALILGHLTEIWPAERLWPIPLSSALLGLLSALPPLLVMLALRNIPWNVIQELTQFVDERLTPMFRGLSLVELALLSLAAGWGEELLFRGLIQAELTHGTNIVVGILMASFVFGLVHFLSPAYFAMAFAISIYFGWLFWQFESLWVPILGHAAYDFLMLVYMRKNDPGAENSSEMVEEIASGN